MGHIGDGNFHSLLLFNPDDTSTFRRAEEFAKRLSEYVSTLIISDSRFDHIIV